MELNYKTGLEQKSPLSIFLELSIFKDTSNIKLRFSKYVNGIPGSGKTKRREIIEVDNILSLNKNCINKIEGLNYNEELTILSSVIKNDKVYHVPLIDFAIFDKRDLIESISKLQEEYNYNIYIFKSGRSFHAYFDTLLTNEEWEKFLGKALLLNKKGHEVTDTRWIGHSLVQGFSSLRLSHNTAAYLSYPILVHKFYRKRFTQTVLVNNETDKIHFPTIFYIKKKSFTFKLNNITLGFKKLIRSFLS